jgi:hypothetical protein
MRMAGAQAYGFVNVIGRKNSPPMIWQNEPNCPSFFGLAHFIISVGVSRDCTISASVLRDCRKSSRIRRRSAFFSRVKRPCLSAFLFPGGAPDPGAPPCIRHRLFSIDRRGPAQPTPAVSSTTTRAREHRLSITLVSACHARRLRPTGLLADSCLGSITGMTLPDWSAIARDDLLPLAGLSSRLLCVTLPRIA